MITFSNKTSNGNFDYTNDELGLVIVGSYALNENIDLIRIDFSFGSSRDSMNSYLSGNAPDGTNMQFNINCNDFILLTKMMSVYDSIVAAIKANYTD